MKKIRSSRGGFTLVETLVVLLVVSLVGIVIVTGISVGVRVYRSSSEFTEASVLAATASTAISDQLRYAAEVTQGAAGAPDTFFCEYGRGCSFSLDEDGRIAVTDGSTESKLLPTGAYSSGLKLAPLGGAPLVDYAWDGERGYFTVSFDVVDASGESRQAVTFQVECLNP